MISINLSLMHGLIAIPIKITTSCPEETEDDSKLMWKFKGSRIGKTIFKRENRTASPCTTCFQDSPRSSLGLGRGSALGGRGQGGPARTIKGQGPTAVRWAQVSLFSERC